MVFSSNVFLLIFLPVFLICYFACPKSWQNIVILLFSVVFYAFGAPTFVFLLLASTALNFYLVKRMHQTANPTYRKLFAGVAILVSLGLLGYFKYANFFMDNLNALLGLFGLKPFAFAKVLLPIGISFFTFQSITYVVDVYRKEMPPMERLTDYMLYILMFPQLIAGPIVRYRDIAEEIRHRERNWPEILQGFYRFVIGLSKKILVADVIGKQVDILLAGDLSAMGTGTAWVTIVAYTMQLYFDFSGYSDMAIGLGKMMGFHFPENFNSPYNAASVSEFWRRWHITLGSFMRNYLYIPLGGNRCSRPRTYFNLWVVFLLSGLWHGASWNFVVWGAYHGFWLVLERMGLGKIYEKMGRLPSVLITFVIVTVGWAIFRIENLSDAAVFISRLFAFDFRSFADIGSPHFFTMLALALVFSFLTLFPFGKKLQDVVFYTDYSRRQHLAAWLVSITLFLFCLGALNATGFSPFIYFRF